MAGVIETKSQREIEMMRASCQMAAETLLLVGDRIRPGMTTEEIVTDFPELTPEHVRAAIEFAALRERRLATA